MVKVHSGLAIQATMAAISEICPKAMNMTRCSDYRPDGSEFPVERTIHGARGMKKRTDICAAAGDMNGNTVLPRQRYPPYPAGS